MPGRVIRAKQLYLAAVSAAPVQAQYVSPVGAIHDKYVIVPAQIIRRELVGTQCVQG